MRRNSMLLIEGLILILFLFSCTSREVKKAKEFMDAGMYEQAISLLEIEIQANPKNAEASFLLGKCFIQTNNRFKVEECFKRAILLNTDYRKDVGNIYFDKSLELYKTDNPSNATSYYGEGLKYNPSGSEEFASKLYNYANEYSETATDPAKSIQIFNAINQISPNYKSKIAEKTYSLAKSFIDKGFIKEGFEYADYGINFDPNHIKDVADLYFNYANSLLTNLNKPNDCIFYFERCLKLNPLKKGEIGNIYFNQAKIFEKNNEINLLLLFAKKSKEINPDYSSWYLQLAEKYKPKIPIDGLVAFYPFNGNANDESGNGNDGTVYGALLTTDRNGKIDCAFNFNGTTSYIKVDGSQFAFTNNLTLAVWINPDNYQAAYAGILDKCHAETQSNWVLQRVSTKNAFYLGCNIGRNCKEWIGYDVAELDAPYIANQWNFLTITKENGVVRTFSNGKLISSYNFNQSAICTTNSPLYIGAVKSQNRNFKGKIDDIRIYNRALTEQEIQSLYKE
jgi:tetratricopeptide (TPR) repeat protein